MQATYQWSSGARIKIDPQTAGERLEAIRARKGGQLDRRDVLADARKTRSPLHQAFEWEDSVAAEQYRLMQAGHLLRAITVVFEDAPQSEPIRAFVHVSKGDDDAAFTHISVALADADMKAQLLKQALAEIEGWRRRYAHLEELSIIFAAADEVLSAHSGRTNRAPQLALAGAV